LPQREENRQEIMTDKLKRVANNQETAPGIQTRAVTVHVPEDTGHDGMPNKL
jgi:hypothetical protein